MILDVVPVVEAALMDEATGLAARAREILSTRAAQVARVGAKELVRAGSGDVALIPWALAGTLQGTAKHNVAVTPAGYAGDAQSSIADVQQQTHTLRVGFETFAADHALRSATVLVYTAAAFMVLRRLREFSDTQSGGTIQEVQDITTAVGTFGQRSSTSPVSIGFITTVTLTEWSAV